MQGRKGKNMDRASSDTFCAKKKKILFMQYKPHHEKMFKENDSL